MAIDRTTYPATAVAVVDSIALVWPSAAWPRLIAKHPALAVNTLQTVGSRLQEAHTRVVEMSTEQVEQRVAHALLRLAQQGGRKVESGVKIDFPISRQDVAEMTGTTLHTVSRILSAGRTAASSRAVVKGSSFATLTSCSSWPKARANYASASSLGKHAVCRQRR
jgi:CRP-like cAMP-binding protein